jgi:hypothetical protein
MRTEAAVVAFGVVFFAVVSAVYWFTSYEEAGTTLLTVTALAYLLLFGYLYLQVRRLRTDVPRPQDREDGEVSDAVVEIEYFPAASVWPAALGLGVAVISLGLVFGQWFFVIGAIVLVGGIIGYAVEAQARP